MCILIRGMLYMFIWVLYAGLGAWILTQKLLISVAVSENFVSKYSDL